MRVEKNGTRYFSFQELPGVGKSKRPRNHVGEESRNKFAGKCRVCGALLSYVPGTNVMVCTNESCKGIVRKVKAHEEDGEEPKERKETFPVFRTLDAKGVEIAGSLFGGAV